MSTTKPKGRAKDRLPPDFVRVRGLTLWRPWALSILAGPKRVENRPRAWSIQGELLALHNGLRFRDEDAAAIHEQWEGYILALERHPELIRPGHIVGVAKVANVLELSRAGERLERFAPWATGPWCYVLQEPVILPKPIPWKGQQGLFNITGEPADEIRRAWFAGRADVDDLDLEHGDPTR